MLRFVVRRLLLLVPILLGLSHPRLRLDQALPGSPAQALLGERATPRAVAQIRHQYGLDQPDLRAVLAATSTDRCTATSARASASRRTVTYELKQRFPATVELALCGDVLRDRRRHPARLLRRQAVRRRGSTTRASSASLIGISIPIFFLGLILKYVFAVRLGWLPSVGREDVPRAEPAAPDQLLHPRRDHERRSAAAFWDAIQASDPARDRARLDPARDHRPDHARIGARRPERGLRPHCAREGHARRTSSTAGTCCGTRCCRSSTIIGLQTGPPALGCGAHRDRSSPGRASAAG